LGFPTTGLRRCLRCIPSLLTDEESLRVGQEKGLTSEEFQQLESLKPRFEQICADLAAYGIPESVNHGDFHDGNVLVKNGRITFFDWGDADVTHPFVSLRTWLVSMEIALELDDYVLTPEMAHLLDCYLEAFEKFASKEDLRKAYALSKPVASVVKALAWQSSVARMDASVRGEYVHIVPAVLQHTTPSSSVPARADLTAAVALAQAGKKVLVLEQHDRPGGWTHSFTLNGYRFSPGVHYIGSLDEGGGLRRIYDGLGVSQDLAFVELNPDGYDHIVVGDKQIDFPKGRENLIERLKGHFPHEAKGIDGYFADLTAMTDGLRNIGRLDKPLQAAKGAGSILKWMRATGADLINAHISDPVLRGVLSGQSGDHGLPPSQVSAFMHAGITEHYLDGGYYPLGGAFTIPRAFVRALKRSGGEIRLKSRVKRILIEGRKVIGVEMESGEEIRAGVVISNADPEVTFGKLIGREHLSVKLKRKVDSVRYSMSCLSLFFATDMDLRGAGLDSGNMWYYDHADVDRIYTDGLATRC
jgi:hypothetical protein